MGFYCFHETTNISVIATHAIISTTTVSKILDTVSFPKPKLPRTILINEFKGKISTGKYQCILIAPIKCFRHFA